MRSKKTDHLALCMGWGFRVAEGEHGMREYMLVRVGGFESGHWAGRSGPAVPAPRTPSTAVFAGKA